MSTSNKTIYKCKLCNEEFDNFDLMSSKFRCKECFNKRERERSRRNNRKNKDYFNKIVLKNKKKNLIKKIKSIIEELDSEEEINELKETVIGVF
jgi:DNA-directed RNA polymerase subunit RPC12/RpoP